MAKNMTWVLVVAVVALGYFAFVQEPAAPVTTTTTTTPAGAVCGSDTTPDLDINAYNIESPGTALTESTNLYRKVGNTAWTSFTAGTAISGLEVGADYEVVMGITASDFTDNAYGEAFKTGAIPCKESIVLDKGEYNDEIETSLTATFYNKNHEAGDANDYETYIAGEETKIYLEWVAGADEVFGNPFIEKSGLGDNGKHRAKYPNILCLNLNKTAWDMPDKVLFGAEEMHQVSVPLLHTTGASMTAYCYEFPVVTDVGQEVSVTLNADDTYAPNCAQTAYLYAGNFFIDAAGDGGLHWGVENFEGTAVGVDAADSLSMNLTSGSCLNTNSE